MLQHEHTSRRGRNSVQLSQWNFSVSIISELSLVKVCLNIRWEMRQVLVLILNYLSL